MGEFQGTQLHQLLQGLEAVSPQETFSSVARSLSQEPTDFIGNLAATITERHPYIDTVSQQFLSLISPQLQAMMLVACQQALEKGHQAAIVQHQSDEDELIASLEQKVTLLQKGALQLEQKLQAEQKNCQASQLEIERLTGLLEQGNGYQEQFETLQAHHQKELVQHSKLKETLAEQQNIIQEKELLLQQSEAALQKQKELNALQSDKVKQLITERSAENASLDDRLKQQETHYQKELSDLKHAFELLQGELESGNANLATQQHAIEEKDSALQQALASLKEKELLLTDINSANGQYTAQIKNLLQEKHKSDQMIAEQQKTFETLQQDLISQRAAVEELNKNKELLSGQVSDKENHLAELQASLTELEQQNEALQAEHASVLEANAQYKDKIAEQEKKQDGRFNDLKKDLFAETKLLKVELEQALSNIVNLEQDKEQMSELLSEFRIKEQAYQDAIAKKESLLANQDSALNMAQGRNTSLVSRLEAESKQARNAYESIRAQNNELNEKIEELEGKVTEFKLKFEYAQQQLNS